MTTEEYDQTILALKYDALVRPALARWMGLKGGIFDPLRDPANAYGLYNYALTRGYDVYGRQHATTITTSTVFDTYVCTITRKQEDGTRVVGQGEGGTPVEALVLACYQIAQHEGER